MRTLLLLATPAVLLLASPTAPAAAAIPHALPADSPSLTANKTKVVYGGAVALEGRVPVTKAGETITLRAEVLQPNGRKESIAIARTTTDGAGAFTFANVPIAQTSYSAVWQAPQRPSPSPPLVVRVAPRISLALVRKVGQVVTFSTTARSAIPYVGRYVFVQRRNALGRWVSLERVVLESNPVATRAVTRLPSGLSRIRVLMPQSQVGTGYVTGVSRVILVRL